MKKPVQILLLIALFPVVGTAREETLEERKQRIVRKYLRERASVTQSDMLVPSDLPEDERITESEKFKDAEIALQREEGGAVPYMPPPPQRPMPPRNNSNWLLDDTSEVESEYGLYGNASEPSIDDGDSLWSAWGEDTLDRPSSGTRGKTDRRYNSNQRIQDREQGYANGSRYQQQDPRGFGAAGGTDLFGRTQADTVTPSDYNTGFGLQDNPRTYGSSPDQGLLNTPLRQMDAYDANRQQRDQGTERSSGFQPYKSPYEKQREQRELQRGTSGSSDREQKQEFQRSNQYQQFKDRNKTYDPLADDAYLDQNRR